MFSERGKKTEKVLISLEMSSLVKFNMSVIFMI